MRLRGFHLLGPAAGATLVLSLRNGLWLIVLSITAAGVVFARLHMQDRHRWLPALLASQAVASATRGTEHDPVEAAASELVVLAKGHLHVLDQAADLAHEEPDPRRWSKSIDRIAAAHNLLNRKRVPGIAPAQTTSAGCLVGWWVAATASLLGVAATSSEWWLIPLFVAYSGALTACTDWREEHHWRPALVAAAARSEPASSTGNGHGPVSVQLALFARGSVRTVNRAMHIIEQWKGPQETKRRGLNQLATAAALLNRSGLAKARSQGTAAGWAATMAITAATWLITR